MKNLKHYVIEVGNDAQRKLAIAFYKRASKKPSTCTQHGRFVGLSNCGWVCASQTKYDHEKIIPFNKISSLADTESRKRALTSVLNTKLGGNVELTKTPKQPEVKKTPSKLLPVVCFWYPSTRAGGAIVQRVVRVVKADADYIIGFDIEDNNRFKKFKRSKTGDDVTLMEFNA